MTEKQTSQTVTLIRHGETEWSRSGRHTGLTDLPLTDRGQKQAEAVGAITKGDRFELVLTSPLLRARETCRLAGRSNEAIVDDDLVEWDYGAYEGRTTADIRQERPGWSVWVDGVIGGESIADVGQRADRVIERVRGVNGDVAIFAHAHILRILTARWLALEPEGGRLFVLDPATISTLGWERETAVIRRWNERC